MAKAIITLKTEQKVGFREATQILLEMKNKMFPGFQVTGRVLVRGGAHLMKIEKD